MGRACSDHRLAGIEEVAGGTRRDGFSNQFRRDGIYQGAAVVDEDELVPGDAGEALGGEMAGAFEGVLVEEIEANAVFCPQAEGDAFEAAGFGVEGFGFGEGVAYRPDL